MTELQGDVTTAIAVTGPDATPESRSAWRYMQRNRLLCAVGGWPDAPLEALVRNCIEGPRARAGSPPEFPAVGFVAHPVTQRAEELAALCQRSLMLKAGPCVYGGQNMLQEAVTEALETSGKTGPRCPVCRGPIGFTLDAGYVESVNLEYAKAWWKWLRGLDTFTWAMPWAINVEHFPGNGEERKQCMRDSQAQAARADFVVLAGGRVSNGMADEAEACMESGGQAWDLSYLGPVPPRDLQPTRINWIPWRPS